MVQFQSPRARISESPRLWSPWKVRSASVRRARPSVAERYTRSTSRGRWPGRCTETATAR
eukprot:8186786-Alexandrium_andersonii.AAC.1